MKTRKLNVETVTSILQKIKFNVILIQQVLASAFILLICYFIIIELCIEESVVSHTKAKYLM